MTTVSTTVATATRALYDLAFQVTPIILVGGIAANVPGNMMPIIGLVGQLASLAQGAASDSDFYARFIPQPGSMVINNAIANYPFANTQVAANAIVQQPLPVSLLMVAPVKDAGGYLTKLSLFTSLRTSLASHNASGGTYHIITPSFLYTNCLMKGMTDVTSGEGKQQQIMWQIDFEKPLITLEDADSATNSLMSSLTSGSQQTTSSWSSSLTSVGTAAQGALSTSGISGMVSTFLSSAI
ncbi:hypothetical protein [Robbsia andropogonis]|uniref:hypothetical protein n=1 Tax=Robbsia andropogonis TaxID=28092 RepID=UPI002A6A3002|nr:hypothetical protein [Robbsia andropogonis]